MTAFATEDKNYTVAEYLEMEIRSEEKNEYFNGKIIRRKDVAIRQCMIATNTMVAIHTAIDNITGTKLMVVGSGLLVNIPAFHYVIYPGAAVVFKSPEFLSPEENVLLNPVLIAEVTSASDIVYNHSNRFAYYKTLPSFCEYVLIEQDTPYITTLYKSAEHTWNDSDADQIDQSIFLRSVNCSIDLKNIYKKVVFAKPL